MRAVVVIVALLACSKDNQSDRAVPAIATPGSGGVAAPIAKPVVEPPRPAQLAHVTIKALGMNCEESCPLRVRYALADIHAVYELGFDLSNEAIFVSYDASLGPAKQVTKPMLAAIKSAGFDPWLSKEAWPADATAQVVLR